MLFRSDAVLRSASIGVKFGPSTDGYVMTTYVDGDGDGIRSEDIRDGTDTADGPSARLGELYPGVRVGVLDGLPAIEASAEPPGDDPVRFGAARLASFAADGSATPGTLYLQGIDGSQYAVRVAGETGRVRAWVFERRGRVWRPM